MPDVPIIERAVETEVSPQEPKRAPGTRSRRISIIAVLALILLFPFIARPIFPAYNYVMQLGIVLLMWIAMSSSWNIIGGFAGYISLGHAVFYAIGGYVSGMMLIHWGVSPFITAPLAGLVAVAFGVVAGLITLRTRGPAFIISTIALLFLTLLFLDNWEFVGGTDGVNLPLAPFPAAWLKTPFYYAMALAAIGSVYLTYRVAHSKFGLGLRAISQDEVKAEVAGINTRGYKVTAFALSAFFIGFVGGIWGYTLTYLRPVAFLAIAIAARMVLMAIIGGRGTVAGPVVGAVLIFAVDEFAVRQFGETSLNIVVVGFLLLIVLIFFPQGVVGSLRNSGRLPAFLDWD